MVGRHEVDGEKQAGGLTIPRRSCARAGLFWKRKKKTGIDVMPWLVHTDSQLSYTEYVRLFTNHSRQPGGQAAAAQYGYWQSTGSRLAVAIVRLREAGASHMEMKDITQGQLAAMGGHF